MPLSLDQLQEAFAATLVADEVPTQLSAALIESGEHLTARLTLYRRNVFGAWRQALAAAYPVVHALVGPECFSDVAHHYCRLHPSTSGDLNQFGARFAEVLATEPATATLPYLGDVAALEWAVHRLHHAADTPPVPRERIAALSPTQLLSSRFLLHPGCWWMASTHPLCSIWTAHQPDSTIELSSIAHKPEFALVTHRRWRVTVVPITSGDVIALDALKAGADMDRTISAALQGDPTFDFAKAFVRWLDCDVFVGVDDARRQ